jgi:hypothetical protein
MGGSPEQSDPVAAAKAQAEAERSIARDKMFADRPSYQSNPYGNQTWKLGPNGQWESQQNLTPEQQQIFNREQATDMGQADLRQQAMQAMAAEMGFDMSGFQDGSQTSMRQARNPYLEKIIDDPSVSATGKRPLMSEDIWSKWGTFADGSTIKDRAPGWRKRARQAKRAAKTGGGSLQTSAGGLGGSIDGHTAPGLRTAGNTPTRAMTGYSANEPSRAMPWQGNTTPMGQQPGVYGDAQYLADPGAVGRSNESGESTLKTRPRDVAGLPPEIAKRLNNNTLLTQEEIAQNKMWKAKADKWQADQDKANQLGSNKVGTSGIAKKQAELLADLPEYQALGAADDATRQRVENALYERQTSRLNPEFDKQERDMTNRLTRMGFVPGTDAYNKAAGEFGRTRNDAYTGARREAIIGGGAEQERLYNMENRRVDSNNALRESKLGERQGLRANRLQEFQALLSGGRGAGANNLNFQGPPEAAMGGGPDLLNATNQQNQNSMNAYNAKQQKTAGMVGAGVTAVATIAMLA